MCIHNSTLLYIISLFNSKFRKCALFSLELSNFFLISLLSIALFDHLLKDSVDYDPIESFSNQSLHDNFSDLLSYLNATRSHGKNESEKPIFESVIIPYIFNETDNPTLAEVLGIQVSNNATSFQRFQMTFRKQEMYREDDPLIDQLLNDLATWPLESIEHYRAGTQCKMFVNFTNNAGRAMMKPMKCSREQETLPDHYMFRDLERHNAEIAAYHLDRALGFRRAAPVVGRRVNVTSEIEEICDEELKETFFISPDKRKCFHGINCSQYCNIMHPLCGEPDLIEVAMIAFMPFYKKGDERHYENPWKRAYSERKKADWLKDNDWCESVQYADIYSTDRRRILDMMDMHILDFLMTNQDRHHYEILSAFGMNDNTTSSIIHLDHGRSFGRAFWDDHVILTPIRQCCLIRDTTLATLLKYHNGPVKLSEHLRKSMANDPIAPILWEPHYDALDRRIGLILLEIRNCIDKTVPDNRIKLTVADELATNNTEKFYGSDADSNDDHVNTNTIDSKPVHFDSIKEALDAVENVERHETLSTKDDQNSMNKGEDDKQISGEEIKNEVISDDVRNS